MRAGLHGRAAVAAVLLLFVVGCGGGQGDGAKDDHPSRTAEHEESARPEETTRPEETLAPLVAHDPPVKFGAASAAALEDVEVGAVALDGRKAYTYASERGRIVVVDLASGERVGDGAGPQGALPDTYGVDTLEFKAPLCERTRPGVGTVGGKRMAVGVFPTVIKGTGTTADRWTFELVAVDATSGQAALRAPLDVPVGGDVCEVAGVSESTAVLVLGGSPDYPTTYGVDLATGKRLWERPDFEGRFVQGGKVVGKDHSGEGTVMTALDASTGKQRWQSETFTSDAEIGTFSPRLIHISESSDYGGDRVLRMSDGKPQDVEGFGERLHEIEKCVHDRAAHTFCFARTVEGGELSGYDAVSGKRLWRVGGVSDTEGREAPLLLTAFHGAVYGRLLEDGRPGDPVVLDGRTGRDRELDPGAAPLVVNEYAALTSQGLYTTSG
ncbi:PQQ-binding-like beta-propeller repeat protein [Streptomyces sp. NPDC056503]|uniref:outer membrane protein assembly factor BamB family protein n=1 Tax=Streptomyces sp. NPDC056503 TaxID=3345842 RepID=UPI003692BDAA